MILHLEVDLRAGYGRFSVLDGGQPPQGAAGGRPFVFPRIAKYGGVTMSKKWLWLTIGAVVLLAGCGGGGGGASSQDWIVGTWELYAISLSLDSYRDPDLGPIASTLRCFSNHEAEWTLHG